jgi:hypothetical protein
VGDNGRPLGHFALWIVKLGARFFFRLDLEQKEVPLSIVFNMCLHVAHCGANNHPKSMDSSLENIFLKTST